MERERLSERERRQGKREIGRDRRREREAGWERERLRQTARREKE